MSIEICMAFAIGAALIQAFPGPGNRLLLSHARSGRFLRTLCALGGIVMASTLMMASALVAVGFLKTLSELFAAILSGIGLAVLIFSAMAFWRIKGVAGLIADNDNLSVTKPLRTLLKSAAEIVVNRWQIAALLALASQTIDPSRPIFFQALVLTSIFLLVAILVAVFYAVAPERALRRLRRLEARKTMGRTRGRLRVSAGIVSVGYRRMAA